MIKTKDEQRLRHELKYSISHEDDFILSSRLSKLFKRDLHADSHGIYRVSSLYFDTPNDIALRQKTDGVNEREKFRLRYYNDDTSFVRLEKKIKTNGLCGKQSVPLTRDQAVSLINNDIDFLLCSDKALLIELYSKMKGQLLAPKTVVRYDREAYIYEPGNVRITLDRNIARGLNATDFLTPKAWSVPAEYGTILEVKYDNFLPELAAMALSVPNRQSGAFSKYAASRRYE